MGLPLLFIFAVIMPATLQSKELQSLEAIAEGSNQFACKLYQAMKNTPGNLVISPISAQIPLALTWAGANGTTAEEMAKVLHLPSNRDQILEGHKALISGLEFTKCGAGRCHPHGSEQEKVFLQCSSPFYCLPKSLKDPVLKLATKLFIAQSYEIKSEFKSIANSYFLSGLEEKDFLNHPSEAREQINGWVEEKTNNKIKNLLPSGTVSSDTRVILVNAIHFKAKWLHAFNPNLTSEAPFHVTPSQTVNVQMMKLYNKKLKYAESESLNAKILELPYEGSEFSMMIILPNEMDGLRDVESKLCSIDLSHELSKLAMTTVNVQLPRFIIESDMKLNQPLIDMGMVSAFSNGANFSGIADEPLKIDSVIQKAFIEVNEEGTEAAAATAASVRARRAIHSAEELICNHPFGFMLVHPPTGSVVFASRLLNIPVDSSRSSSHDEL